ncbi:hypothetical protein JCM1841_004727 [Sporobolomyces salmonicolor]
MSVQPEPQRRSSVRRQSSYRSTEAPANVAAGGSPRSSRLTSRDLGASEGVSAQNNSASPRGKGRASIGHALRIEVPSPAPPARRSTYGNIASPAVPSTPPSQHTSPGASQAVPLSPRTVPPRSPASASPRVPPLDSPKSAYTPPRTSSLRQASVSSGRSISNMAASNQEDAQRSPGIGVSGSTRRKPPAPLDLLANDAPRLEAREDSSVSSNDDEHLASGGAGALGNSANLSLSTPGREEEERDTLSGLVDFRPSTGDSPVINMRIPSSRLSLSDDADNDDTVASGFSFLSSTSGSSNGYEAEQARPYKPSAVLSSSTSGYDAPNSRPYQGLGLGLPFSVSAAANLSSLGASPPSTSRLPSVPSTITTTVDPYRSPQAADRSTTSPVADRGQLIGLGELATPRWTSAPLERRWGTLPTSEEKGTAEEEPYDLLATYGIEPEPMPATRIPAGLVDSPTVARPPPHRPAAGRTIPAYDSSPNRPFGQGASASLYPVPLLPTSASTMSISTNLSPAALLNFGHEPGSTFGSLEFTAPSPVYSLEAASNDGSPNQQQPEEKQPETARDSQLPTPAAEVSERNALGKRKSTGTASSAPNSAGPGATWSVGSGKDVVGLGFDYEVGGGTTFASTSGAEEGTVSSRRRVSGGSVTSASTKRSSARSSTDGKTAMKHRRQSTSKSSFAHLPPSPAAATASHVFSASGSSTAPAVPPIAPHNVAPASAPPPLSSSTQSTPSGRTPDHARLSRHSFYSHHSSPSIIAASILRQTRDLEGVDIDIEQAAAVDEGTAEALRKLDGLSSPKMSRIASGGTTPDSRSRKSSRGPIEMPPNPRRDSEDKDRRRTRSSTGSVAASLAKDGGDALSVESTPSRRTSASASPAPALPSTSAFASPPPQPVLAKSHLVSSTSQMSSSQISSASTTRPASTRVPSVSGYEVPFPSVSPFKRGSSSSASMTAGTSPSASGSHDSTSATSLATRSAASKARRGSVSSDVSSVHSGTDGRPGLDRADSIAELDQVRDIPPVPPLPKDWETYRPTTGGTAASASSTPYSPRFDAEARRPSVASSFAESTQHSPRAPTMELSSSRDSVAVKEPSGRRKWSISSAFHKASKSPKTSAIKESSSYGDLHAQRETATSFGHQLSGDRPLPRRMAASTNDIAGLAGVEDEPRALAASSTGSLGRSSIRSEKVPSLIARTRTSSQSSSSTTRTAGQQPTGGLPPPSVVATSPGRSRSSLINPRRTPSGIPFFSRKSSYGEPSVATPSPNLDKGEMPSTEERSGRKSILGLNFLRSGGSKRDKDKAPVSPPSAKRSTFSSSTSLRASDAGMTDEFGRRASLATPKTTGLLARKRGKTISSADQGDDVFNAKPVHLPPMSMAALSPTTAKRVDALTFSHSSSTSTSGYNRPAPSGLNGVVQTPRTRTSKLQDSLKANLPTIAGSPSTHAFPSTEEPHQSPHRPSPSSTPPPKSHTPTKIPRLHRSAAVTSPRPQPRLSEGSRTSSPAGRSLASKTSSRRLSSYGGSGDTSAQLTASFASSVGVSSTENDTSSDFGIANREPGLSIGEKTLSTRRRLDSEPSAPSGIPRSRSTTGSLVSTKQSMDPLASSTSSRQSTALPRATRRPSVVDDKQTPARATRPRLSSLSISRSSGQIESDLSSSSSASTALASASRRTLPKPGEVTGPRRSSVATTEALPASKSSRGLSTKAAIPSRVPKSSASATSSRLSPSISGTESGRSSSASHREVDEDEVRGDEEMAAYVRRQMSKKLNAGMSEDAIRKMFEFPDPTDPLPPLDPKDALSLYSRYLSPYEKEEMRDYSKVYFVGPNCDKKPAAKEVTTNNHGYDDDRGDYLIVSHDHIQYRYEVIDVLGKGSFGQVLQCRDHKTGEMVAIKIIRNKKRFHHQALVEIKVLENLVKWDPDEKHFVIRMVDSFTFRGHLCIVTELLSINLYELVKANNFAGFSTTLIRRFTLQILGSLSLLRHHRVVHCDLKPENILLKHPAKSAIKVIDFGSSCFEHEKVYTYIQSRFYRSPEVILGMNYHMGIDMWSLGCIIAEMYTGYPIFPGENEQEQLACIMEVMGLPEKYLVDRSSRKRLFFDSTGAPRPVVNSKGRRRRPGSKTLAQVLKTDDELFIDFIAKCLTWDPDRRLKPDPALRHPWIAQNRNNNVLPPTIPSRTSRASALASSTSSAARSTIAGPSSPSISTPLKKLPQPASTSTAPVPRTRTFSSSTITTSSGATRLGSKASLGLPPSTRYQVKS